MPMALMNLREPCILLTVIPENGNSEGDAEKLMQRFGLTAAETQVVLLIRDGLSPVEIADIRSVSAVTVRNQIKSALSKCGVRRQSELVSLLLGKGW